MNTGFHIDIYTLSDFRNKEIIDKFLNQYTDRKSIESTKDFELALLKNGEYVYVKSETLTNSIDIGLSNFENCFTLYFSSNKPNIENVILTFTNDGKLIFGISINENPANYELAKNLTEELLYYNFGKLSYFGIENIPALNADEFFENMELNK